MTDTRVGKLKAMKGVTQAMRMNMIFLEILDCGEMGKLTWVTEGQEIPPEERTIAKGKTRFRKKIPLEKIINFEEK